MKYNFLKMGFIVLPLLFLTSCETAKKTYKVLSDPGIRVGDRLEQPTAYTLSIFATNRININPYADASDLNNEDVESSLEEPVEEALDSDEEEGFSQSKPAINTPAVSKGHNYSAADQLIFEEKNEDTQQSTPVLIRVFQLSEKSLFLSSTYDELNDNFKTKLGKTYIDHDELMIDPNQFRFIGDNTFKEGARYLGVIAYFNDEKDRQWRDIVRIRSKGEFYPFLIRITENKINLYKDN
ncbi:type VI secretion system lipoprotein TssJ [Pasteurella atlantica]|uniref:Type VI secretion system lipoprotein TssJ n=2 Tax=Pasteurellaceae TaxID=712 RepID=A0ACC6HP15_9PAST|nr:type VI secretion system lipoprotein TssJ [Pasteurella atlantica]MDP8052626.1 type VI secretion system lipoprotein TssJ [Pasteurella atlantica]MDP8105774.1 type VI secretion system lipoprotein TssJ [Pasteurella atlantica]MDP8149284.1 type VI secretion system lipoprotein TssJ [Pasteurella atlantica]